MDNVYTTPMETNETEIIMERFDEESKVFKQDNQLLTYCQSGEERIPIKADREQRVENLNALLDYYNEEVLGITYKTC